MSTETENWKVTPGVGNPRPRTMTVRHWDADHALTLNPEAENLAAVFEDGKRLGWINTRIKPGTKTTRQFRYARPTLDPSGIFVHETPVKVGGWHSTRAEAISALLKDVKAPAEVARRQRAKAAAQGDAGKVARLGLRSARTVLAAAEDARDRAITDRRNAVSYALAAGMTRADIAAELDISRQMVDRLADDTR